MPHKGQLRLLSWAGFIALAACHASPPNKEEIDRQNIAAFCNGIAAEMVANPNSDIPWRKLQQKHLEEEWRTEDVDRICSDAVKRKARLMSGRATEEQGNAANGAISSGQE